MFNEEKFKRMFWLVNKWFALRQYNIGIQNHKLWDEKKKIAVYGLGEIGKRLIDELDCLNNKVEYVVDMRADSLFADFPIFSPKEFLPPADLMIITVINDSEKVTELMKEKFTGKIITLETMVDDLWISYWQNNYFDSMN